MLIETDIIVASIIPDHTHHDPALRVLQTENPLLTPYAQIELNLLIRAGRIKVKSFQRFSRSLERLLHSNGVETISDRLAFHAKAKLLEDRYKISFFDTLHAATALINDESLCSFDHTYQRLKREGLRLIDPRSI